jgi:hypothetical protein
MAVSQEHDGWIGFGLGTQMVGSSVVIAFPTSGKEELWRPISVSSRCSLFLILIEYVLILWNVSVVHLAVFKQHTVVGE